MNEEDKNNLFCKIAEDFEKFCNKYDEWCSKCPYSKIEGVHCEIAFTLSFLNKRNKLKAHK